MSTRYVRDTDLIAAAISATRRGVRDVQRPTGTERARTMDTAIIAAEDSEFAKQLAEQLRVELEAAQLELAQALADAASALEEAGLARSEAATAVAEAQAAAADAAQAINDALEASNLANGAVSFEDRPPVAGDADGKPLGAVWYQLDADGIVAFWELQALGWIARDLTETVIPKIQIGEGTYGDLDGIRLTARTILADRIAALSLTANEIAANAITAVKIAADAVTAEKILAGSVTTGKLDALAVTAEKLAVGSVVAEKIATGAIVAGKIAADAIDGMVITGATIRTAATGQRMQFDINGMSSFNAAGVRTAVLSAGDGSFLLQGAGGTVDDPSGYLSYNQIGFGSGGRITPGGLYKRSALLHSQSLQMANKDPASDDNGSDATVTSSYMQVAHSLTGFPNSPRTYANISAGNGYARLNLYKTGGGDFSDTCYGSFSAFFDSNYGKNITRIEADVLQLARDAKVGGKLEVVGEVTVGTTNLFPIGGTMMWDSDVIPQGWLLRNGQAVSRTTYAKLFALWGTRYGAGNGTTTFNVPDQRGYVAVGKSADTEFDTLGKKTGAKTHTLTEAELASHSHGPGGLGSNFTTYRGSGGQIGVVAGGTLDFAPATASRGGGQAHNNIQPSFTLNFITRAL